MTYFFISAGMKSDRHMVLKIPFSIFSTIAPPLASDGFETDSAPFSLIVLLFAGPTCSCGCYYEYKSITGFCSIWPHVAVNILYFSVYAIDGWGRGLS